MPPRRIRSAALLVLPALLATAAAARADCPPVSVSFSLAAPVSVNGYPAGCAAADFDGDGLRDVAVSFMWGDAVAVYRGNGAGAFSPWHTIPVGRRPHHVAAGDLDHDGRLVLADDGVAPGTTALYRLAFTTSEGTFHSTPSTIAVPALALSLEGARPNPAPAAKLALAFSLRTSASATLELYDVTGRRVVAREVGALGPGRHVLDLADQHLLGGVYLARLTQGGEQRQARIVVL